MAATPQPDVSLMKNTVPIRPECGHLLISSHGDRCVTCEVIKRAGREHEIQPEPAVKATTPKPLPPSFTIPAPACIHRGRPVREGACDLCGRRDQTVEVRSCAIFGECTSEQNGRVRGVRRCQGCPDATTDPNTPLKLNKSKNPQRRPGKGPVGA